MKYVYVDKMKTYITNGYEYFFDKNQKQWVLYPIGNLGNRIEWDENDNPIEARYFNNRKELNKWLLGQIVPIMYNNSFIKAKYSF